MPGFQTSSFNFLISENPFEKSRRVFSCPGRAGQKCFEDHWQKMLIRWVVTMASIIEALIILSLTGYVYASSRTNSDAGMVAFESGVVKPIHVIRTSLSLEDNPVFLESWTVVLDTAATTVKSRVGLDGSSGEAWVTCTSHVPFTTWFCPAVPGKVKIEDVTSLQVSAVNDSR
jgi:hypothetical protein